MRERMGSCHTSTRLKSETAVWKLGFETRCFRLEAQENTKLGIVQRTRAFEVEKARFAVVEAPKAGRHTGGVEAARQAPKSN